MTKTISMRGTLKFTFPAHASARVRKAVVARFTLETQQRIDAEEERERDLSRVRAALTGAGLSEPLTFAEAAKELGVRVKDIEAAVDSRRLCFQVVGYQERITRHDLESYRATPASLWFLRIPHPEEAPPPAPRPRTPPRGRNAMARAA